MTEAAWRIVVADAGPLIHLDELDSLDLLDFGEILVPDAVWTELTRHRPAALAAYSLGIVAHGTLALTLRSEALNLLARTSKIVIPAQAGIQDVIRIH